MNFPRFSLALMNIRGGKRATTVLLCGVVLIQLLFAAQIDAQRPKSLWQTLSGDAPLVIARGGFSGLFPDSSLAAYSFAKQVSVPGAVLWCDVQLTKDGDGICFPDLKGLGRFPPQKGKPAVMFPH